jgi:hypothetical protein
VGTDCSRSTRGAVHPQAVTFEKREWDAEAERGLSRTLGDYRDEMVRNIRDGVNELYRINGGQSWLVTRVEGKALVVVCVQGSGLKDLAAVLHQAMQAHGLKRALFWTQRPALARMLKRYGFAAKETLFEMKIT